MDVTNILCEYAQGHPPVDGDVTDRYADRWVQTRPAVGIYPARVHALCNEHADALPAMVDAVKTHATAHYDDGGWDVVVECWDDGEITEHLIVTGTQTPDAAVAVFADAAGVWADRQADARNSAF